MNQHLLVNFCLRYLAHHMKSLTSYCWFVTLALGMISCDIQDESSEARPPPLYKPPPAYLFNPEGGYDYNPLTNRPILPFRHPITNQDIVTGKPYQLNGEHLAFSEIKEIDTMPALPVKDWEVVWVRPNNNIAEWVQAKNTINWDSLESFDINEVHSDFQLWQRKSHTYQEDEYVPTGKPIAVSPIKVAIPYSQSEDYSYFNTELQGTYNFRNLGTPTGRENSNNESITIDSLSNIWVKSDGYNYCTISRDYIANYKNRNKISSQKVLRDSKGNIWSTKSKELLKFDGVSFTSFPLPGNTTRINVIMEDNHGNIWLGLNGYGLCKFDGKTYTYYTTREG